MVTGRELDAARLNERADRDQVQVNALRERMRTTGEDLNDAIYSLESRISKLRAQAVNRLSGGSYVGQEEKRAALLKKKEEEQKKDEARQRFEETQQYFRENPDLLQRGKAVEENVRRTAARQRFRETQQAFVENPGVVTSVPEEEYKRSVQKVFEAKQQGYRFEEMAPYAQPVLVKREQGIPGTAERATSLQFVEPKYYVTVPAPKNKVERALETFREGARVDAAIAGSKAEFFGATGKPLKAVGQRIKQAEYKLERARRGVELGIVQNPVETALIVGSGFAYGALGAGLSTVSKAAGVVGRVGKVSKTVFDITGLALLGGFVGASGAELVKSKDKSVVVGKVIRDVGAFGVGSFVGGGVFGLGRGKLAEKRVKSVISEDAIFLKGRKNLPVVVEKPVGEIVLTRGVGERALSVVPKDLATTFRVRPVESFVLAQEQGAGFTRGALEKGKTFRFVKGKAEFLEFKDIPEYQNYVLSTEAKIIRPLVTDFGVVPVETTRKTRSFINLDTFNRLVRGNEITTIDSPVSSTISVGDSEGISLFGFGEKFKPRAVLFAKGLIQPVDLATSTEIIPVGKPVRSNPFVYRERISRQQPVFGGFDRKYLMYGFEESLTLESGTRVYRAGGFFRPTQKGLEVVEIIKPAGKPLKPFVYGSSEVRSSPSPVVESNFVDTKVKSGGVQRLLLKTKTVTKQKVKSLSEALGVSRAKSETKFLSKSGSDFVSGKSQTASESAVARKIYVLEGVKVRAKPDLGRALKSGSLGLAAVLSGQNARGVSDVLSEGNVKVDVISLSGVKVGSLSSSLVRAGLRSGVAQKLSQSLATDTLTLQGSKVVSVPKVVSDVVPVSDLVTTSKFPEFGISGGGGGFDDLKKVKGSVTDANKVSGEGFGVLIKRKGKFVRVGPALVKEEALDLGAKLTATSLAAQFKVVPVKEKPVRSGVSGSFSRLRSTFRSFKVVKGRKVRLPEGQFIEKRKFRLSTRGEVSEIKAAKVKSFLGRGGLL